MHDYSEGRVLGRSIHLARLLTLCLACCAPVLASTLTAQTFQPPQVQWEVSDSADPLTVSGISFDLDSETGLDGVQVYIRDPMVGVLTNRLGKFELKAPRSGTHALEFLKIGYWPQTIEIRIPEERGVEVYVEMSRVPEWCEIFPSGTLGRVGAHVRAEVRDASTGRAPTSQFVVHAESATSADSVVVEPADADSVSFLLKLSDTYQRHESPLTITVSSATHEPWRVSNIWLIQGCPDDRTPLLQVGLIPQDYRGLDQTR
jgi:hypothetical protein